MRTQVISIGYEQRSISEFLDVLLEHKVEKLVDVRELPLSRKKGFSKASLSESLSSVGIQYRHVRAAGNPHRKQKSNIDQCLALYSNYLKNNPHVLEVVAAELSKKPTAILCYERKHRNCHRSILLDSLCQNGFRYRLIEVQ